MRKSKKKKGKIKISSKKIVKRKIVKKDSEKKKVKNKFPSGRIQKILNQSHPDDLYITIKIIPESEINKLLIYFRKNKSKLNKKKELSKVIAIAKNKKELLDGLKNYPVNILKKEHEDLKQQASILRKKGKDLLIEDLKLMRIPSKIRIFEVTEDKKDFYFVKQMLDKIKSEINLKS